MLIKKKTILWIGAQKKLIHVIRARKTSYEIQFHNEISNWSLTTNLLSCSNGLPNEILVIVRNYCLLIQLRATVAYKDFFRDKKKFFEKGETKSAIKLHHSQTEQQWQTCSTQKKWIGLITRIIVPLARWRLLLLLLLLCLLVESNKKIINQ